MKKIYVIGIGGIGISAIARYYNQNGYEVFGSDSTNSELIKKLINEGIKIKIGTFPEIIDSSFEKIIFTEAVPNNHSELKKAKELKLKTLNYPESVAEIANNKKLIAISGTHGKSTTTSMASILLKNSEENFTSIVGTILKEFDGSNFYHRKNKKSGDDFFILEACEYKRSFLKYEPSVLIITNIELDHLDYYKDLEDYINAYRQMIDKVKKGGFVILNGKETNSRQLIGYRQDINYIIIDNDKYIFNGQEFEVPELDMSIPGEHIYYDASLVYILGQMIGIDKCEILNSLNQYNGVWRRMEEVGNTLNGNLILSDYGHHPTEIKLTLKSIRQKYKDKKILTIFQPHQYNRTIELLKDFKDSFLNTDILIVPDIYESRDSIKDKEKMNTKIFLDNINHDKKINGEGLEKTLEKIKEFDNSNKDIIIVLMGAGNIDNLRYDLLK